jgi:hypothetical protein
MFSSILGGTRPSPATSPARLLPLHRACPAGKAVEGPSLLFSGGEGRERPPRPTGVLLDGGGELVTMEKGATRSAVTRAGSVLTHCLPVPPILTFN